MNAQEPADTVIIGPLSHLDEWAAEWNADAGRYKANPGTIEAIQRICNESDQSIDFTVYLGTWCSDSREFVPAFLSIAEQSKLTFKLIGLNREKECPLEDCSSWDISFVPTIIVTKAGEELGRMVETPQKTVEDDLLQILSTKK